jgi:hypothetical protein
MILEMLAAMEGWEGLRTSCRGRDAHGIGGGAPYMFDILLRIKDFSCKRLTCLGSEAKVL